MNDTKSWKMYGKKKKKSILNKPELFKLHSPTLKVKRREFAWGKHSIPLSRLCELQLSDMTGGLKTKSSISEDFIDGSSQALSISPKCWAKPNSAPFS